MADRTMKTVITLLPVPNRDSAGLPRVGFQCRLSDGKRPPEQSTRRGSIMATGFTGKLMENQPMETDWIGELADTAKTFDRQHREHERRRAEEAQAIAASGEQFWFALVVTVERDLLRFRQEFADEPGRSLILEKIAPDSFRVIRAGLAAVKLSVQLKPSGRHIEFRYEADDESATLKSSGILDMRADRNGALYLNQYGRDFLNFDDVSRMLLERIFKGVAFH